MKSELLACDENRFTGATSHMDGLYKAAGGRTLFFDYVGKLPLSSFHSLDLVIEKEHCFLAIRYFSQAAELTPSACL